MISIVTDSTCYLPPEFIRKYNISVVPLKVQIGTETYNEITGLSNRDFYQRLATADIFPKTSQPSVAEFKATYQNILAQDPVAEILVLTISSKLSGTHSAAVTAGRQLPQANITVFDTLSAAMGVGLIVMAAAKMAVNGRSLTEVKTRLAQMRQDLTIFFVVDTLEYLKRGGRMGAAAAFLGTLFDTKPILAVIDGEIRPLDRVRTKKKAIGRLFTEFQDKLADPHQPIQAGVMHVVAEAEAKKLGQMLKDHFNVTYFFVSELGPTIGAHLGPGALGLGFCPEPE